MSAALLEAGIYTVISRDEHTVSVCFSDASHPVFKAHFKDNPILPGFMQIDIIAAILNKRVTAISMAKFMKPLRPGDAITYHLAEGSKTTRVTLKGAGGEKVSDFKLRWETL